MALAEFDKLKQVNSQKNQAQSQIENDAIKRRFSAMGNLNSGSYIKQQQIQADNAAQREDTANTQVDVAGAAEEQRRKELGEQNAFRDKAFDSDVGFKNQDMGFKKRALDTGDSQFAQSHKLAERQVELEGQAQGFNMDLANREYEDSQGGMIQGIIGKKNGGSAAGGIFGSVVKGAAGIFGGGGSYFCTEMRDKKYISTRGLHSISPLLSGTIWTRPEFVDFYLTIAPKVLEVTRRENYDWTKAKEILFDKAVTDLKEGFFLSAQLNYMRGVKKVCLDFEETKHLWDDQIMKTTIRKRVVAFVKLMKREETREIILSKFMGAKKCKLQSQNKIA